MLPDLQVFQEVPGGLLSPSLLQFQEIQVNHVVLLAPIVQ